MIVVGRKLGQMRPEVDRLSRVVVDTRTVLRPPPTLTAVTTPHGRWAHPTAECGPTPSVCL